jgi:hypothetical protein
MFLNSSLSCILCFIMISSKLVDIFDKSLLVHRDMRTKEDEKSELELKLINSQFVI